MEPIKDHFVIRLTVETLFSETADALTVLYQMSVFVSNTMYYKSNVLTLYGNG